MTDADHKRMSLKLSTETLTQCKHIQKLCDMVVKMLLPSDITWGDAEAQVYAQALITREQTAVVADLIHREAGKVATGSGASSEGSRPNQPGDGSPQPITEVDDV